MVLSPLDQALRYAVQIAEALSARIVSCGCRRRRTGASGSSRRGGGATVYFRFARRIVGGSNWTARERGKPVRAVGVK
jgi:hypothetical protein